MMQHFEGERRGSFRNTLPVENHVAQDVKRETARQGGRVWAGVLPGYLTLDSLLYPAVRLGQVTESLWASVFSPADGDDSICCN